MELDDYGQPLRFHRADVGDEWSPPGLTKSFAPLPSGDARAPVAETDAGGDLAESSESDDSDIASEASLDMPVLKADWWARMGRLEQDLDATTTKGGPQPGEDSSSSDEPAGRTRRTAAASSGVVDIFAEAPGAGRRRSEDSADVPEEYDPESGTSEDPRRPGPQLDLDEYIDKDGFVNAGRGEDQGFALVENRFELYPGETVKRTTSRGRPYVVNAAGRRVGFDGLALEDRPPPPGPERQYLLDDEYVDERGAVQSGRAALEQRGFTELKTAIDDDEWIDDDGIVRRGYPGAVSGAPGLKIVDAENVNEEDVSSVLALAAGGTLPALSVVGERMNERTRLRPNEYVDDKGYVREGRSVLENAGVSVKTQLAEGEYVDENGKVRKKSPPVLPAMPDSPKGGAPQRPSAPMRYYREAPLRGTTLPSAPTSPKTSARGPASPASLASPRPPRPAPKLGAAPASPGGVRWRSPAGGVVRSRSPKVLKGVLSPERAPASVSAAKNSFSAITALLAGPASTDFHLGDGLSSPSIVSPMDTARTDGSSSAGGRAVAGGTVGKTILWAPSSTASGEGMKKLGAAGGGAPPQRVAGEPSSVGAASFLPPSPSATSARKRSWSAISSRYKRRVLPDPGAEPGGKKDAGS